MWTLSQHPAKMRCWRRYGSGFSRNPLRHWRSVLVFLRSYVVGGCKWPICPSTWMGGYGGAAVGYARLPLPSVDNSLLPDLVWVPALPQPTGRFVDSECPVSRWRLARESPFLEERSPESIRSLGPGCNFRNTTYRVSDYAEPLGDYGFPLHHPRFVELIGAPTVRMAD